MVSEALTNASPSRPISGRRSTEGLPVDSIHLPNAIALPNAFGAPGAPLSPGQVVQALVLELIESDVFRLQLPQAVIDVRANVVLSPGSTITLAVKGSGQNAQLTIYADGLPAQSVAQDSAWADVLWLGPLGSCSPLPMPRKAQGSREPPASSRGSARRRGFAERMRDDADLAPGNRRVPGRRRHEVRHRLQVCRLPGAVRAEQCDELAFVALDRHVVQNLDASVVDVDPLRAQERHRFPAPTARRPR